MLQKKTKAQSTLAEVIKEMARPRVAMSARVHCPELRHTVAFILKREQSSVIAEWLRRVNLVPELTNIPLSDADRTGHLPELFGDVISRLRLGKDAQPLISIAAMTHGKIRFAQGYSAAMLVEESRIFEVSAFSSLHLHRSELNQRKVMLDVITIADEADSQLTETVRGFVDALKTCANLC